MVEILADFTNYFRAFFVETFTFHPTNAVAFAGTPESSLAVDYYSSRL